mmetsp:Transcript_110416/g.352032  ORF Transcript_110416/g.352032 Transcript_110416/m.352032 type:complete len:262 (+) Transcript_110416:1807-2592(+)
MDDRPCRDAAECQPRAQAGPTIQWVHVLAVCERLRGAPVLAQLARLHVPRQVVDSCGFATAPDEALALIKGRNRRSAPEGLHDGLGAALPCVCLRRRGPKRVWKGQGLAHRSSLGRLLELALVPRHLVRVPGVEAQIVDVVDREASPKRLQLRTMCRKHCPHLGLRPQLLVAELAVREDGGHAHVRAEAREEICRLLGGTDHEALTPRSQSLGKIGHALAPEAGPPAAAPRHPADAAEAAQQRQLHDVDVQNEAWSGVRAN